jgi:serine/threonine protein kinase
MPAPTSVDEFVDLIRRSSVLDEPRLSSYVQKLRSDPTTPRELSGVAGLFVRDGMLTYFQAEQFLQGKWKRFTIGKYKVLERLGSGGMGQVFLCEHKLMRRRVAVKVLPTAKATDPSSLERFYREARAVAALDHQNIVRAYDIDQDDNLHFLVMEYVDGASLQDIIRKTGPMGVTRACHYVYWSAIGLQHAHAAGLIHRDIKPGNILVDRTGVVKILDLGLARFFNDDQDLLTKKYDESVLGTADYLAPEQAVDSHTVDGRADIYSLGATFYFLLTGNPPFAEGTVAQKLFWHQSRTPKPIREVRPEVPADVAAVLTKMMSKKPEDRYQTPALLAEAMLRFTQTPIPPPPDEEMPQLSVAAQGTSSGPATVAAASRTATFAPKTPAPTHGPRAPTTSAPANPPPPAPAPAKPQGAGIAVAGADVRRNKPAPVVEPIPESVPGAPIWEAISAETANAARADTDRRKRDGKSSRKYKSPPTEPKPNSKPGSKSGYVKGGGKAFPLLTVLAIAAGAVLLAAAAYAVYWFGIRDKSSPSTPTSTEPRTLIVTKAATPDQFATLQKAVNDFRTGDTIVLLDPVIEEVVSISRQKGIAIMAPEGKRVIWKTPPGKGITPHLLSLYATEGIRISGITFQTEGRAEHAIRIAGSCPGLVLEDVECLDANTSPLAFHDCAGDPQRPITIRKVRLANPGEKDARAGVLFTADTKPGNQHVQFRNCVVEGPYRDAAFQFEGSAVGVEIRNCRVWNAASGVSFGKPKPETTWRVDVANNTFHTMSRAGLWFRDGPAMMRPEMLITVLQNYFIGTSPVTAVEGDISNPKFVKADGNYRKNGAQPGRLVGTEELTVDLPADPKDRGRFLTYDRTNPLFTASNGQPVGAPPPY